MRRSVTQAIFLLSKMALILPCAPVNASTKTEVCLEAPYSVEIAYAFVPQDKDHWEASGWWKLNPGKCLALEYSRINAYYMYAAIRDDDFIASRLKTKESEWSGDPRHEKSAQICIPPDKGFQRDARICAQKDLKKDFFKFSVSGNSARQTLSLSRSEAESIGFHPQSLEEVSLRTEELKKQIIYGDELAAEPIGTPFRLGLKTIETKDGVFVVETVPGMAGYHIFLPKDRLVNINGTEIHTKSDFIYALQEIGYTYLPQERYAKIMFDREDKRLEIPLTPNCTQESTCLDYHPFLDPRVQENTGRALIRGTMGGVFWGFDGELFCFSKAAIEAYEDIHKSQRDRTCVKRLRREREELRETHESIMAASDFAGSLTSPRFVWRMIARTGAKRSLRNIVAASADEAWQGALSYKGKASPYDELTVDNAIRDALYGAAIGATTSTVTGH